MCSFFLKSSIVSLTERYAENVNAEIKILKECEDAKQNAGTLLISDKIMPTCNCDNGS